MTPHSQPSANPNSPRPNISAIDTRPLSPRTPQLPSLPKDVVHLLNRLHGQPSVTPVHPRPPRVRDRLSLSFILRALTALSQTCGPSWIHYHSPLHLTCRHSAMHHLTPSPPATFQAPLPPSIRNPSIIILRQMSRGNSYTNPESSSQSFREFTNGRRRPSCPLNRPNLLLPLSGRFGRQSLHPHPEGLFSMRDPLRIYLHPYPHPLLPPPHR